MLIGNRVKEARKSKGLSQQELGDMLGVSKVSVCGYETGTRIPTLENFLQLIDILDLTPDYLLGREVNVVAEDTEEYSVKLSKCDIEIINEIKKHSELYNMLIKDSKRTVELISRKIK
jgi:transcriptional regulator with XRE-family HTH domain